MFKNFINWRCMLVKCCIRCHYCVACYSQRQHLWSETSMIKGVGQLVLPQMPFLCSLVFTEETFIFGNFINWRCMLVSVALDAVSVQPGIQRQHLCSKTSLIEGIGQLVLPQMPFLCSLVFTEATVMFGNFINWSCMQASVALDAVSVQFDFHRGNVYVKTSLIEGVCQLNVALVAISLQLGFHRGNSYVQKLH